MNKLITLIMSISGTWLLVSSIILLSINAATTEAAVASISKTNTSIKHLVVIFQENVSFDHYFATYPNATNPSGEPKFTSSPATPSVNGLSSHLLVNNPNGNYSVNPFRLDRSQAITCDMDHEYPAEQQAYHGGLLDKFIEFASSTDSNCTDAAHKKQVMGYFDGNTVTALWNYAQHFAMSDNSFATTFGPSTPGALNLISGQTHGATPANIADTVANGTVIADPDPRFDDCSSGTKIAMSGRNIGTILNSKNITWGWFQGGFKPTSKTADGRAVCGSVHKNINGTEEKDYVPHHEPFMYYSMTANPHHLPPTKVAMIGNTDQAHHQYDLSDFWNAAENGNLPAVSFLKAPKYQNGHAGYSDPIDEQHFLVSTINRIEQLPEWSDIAIIISYDDSDGWYDHVMPPIISQSNDPKYDKLLGSDLCGHVSRDAYQDRCGYGPRLPLLVISPYSKTTFVDHSITDQTSIIRFIEDNWGLGRLGNLSFDAKAGKIDNMMDFSDGAHASKLFLDPNTGMQTLASNG
jgi:phospholipase C